MLYEGIAVLSTWIYLAGMAGLKVAARSMPVLSGDRPGNLGAAILGSRTWAVGATVMALGACAQTAAFTRLSTFQAQPMFLAGVLPLLLIALAGLGEQLTWREWGCVLLLIGALALYVDAFAGTGEAGAYPRRPPAALTIAVALPSLLIPVIRQVASDLARPGRHSRPLTGVALAVNFGLLIGTAELMLKGAADLIGTSGAGALVTAPYLYLFALAAPLALCQLQIALQRSRMVIVGLVATATAKSYLLVMAIFLFGEPWPDAADQIALALLASLLAIIAIPHHEATIDPPLSRRVLAGGDGRA